MRPPSELPTNVAAPYAQGVDEGGDEPLEESGRVVGGGLALSGEPGRSRA